jgi:DNA topoisomerase-1
VQGGGESGAPLRRTAVTPAAAAKLDLEGALAALALPRELGPHPTDGAPVMAGSGRWVNHSVFVRQRGRWLYLDSCEFLTSSGVSKQWCVHHDRLLI